MSLLYLIILLPFVAALLTPLFSISFRKIHTGWFVILIPLILFVVTWFNFSSLIMSGETMQSTLAWVPLLDIDLTLYLDGLAFLFIILITGIGALVVLYSIYYLDKNKEPLANFYVYLLLFMGAMLGVVLSDNLIVLYAFWELTSLSSALLIGFWYIRDKSRFGAQKSMLITVFGGFAMLIGFSLLYVMTGTFSIREIIGLSQTIVSHSLFIPAMICVLLGAFTKSAQFPFHIWLPDAMEAPTPVSAYLHSATMVKAGIYLVARMMPVFGGTPEWFWIISLTGLTTLCWGSFSAVRQKDLKALLAFSTISQLGLIMLLLGVGSASLYPAEAATRALYGGAIVTAIFHLINHATFKGSLFMVVGIIDHETGTRDIRKLGGLMSIMPVTFTISAVGLASMAGIPPFNGFISKEMFFTSVLDAAYIPFFSIGNWGVLLPLLAWLASVFTFIYCAIFLIKTFFGNFREEVYHKTVQEASPGLLISPIILGFLVIILGLFPNLLVDLFIQPSVASVLTEIPAGLEPIRLSLWHGFNTELMMSIGVVILGSLIFASRKHWKTWAVYQRERDAFNSVYDRGLNGLTNASQLITRVQMTGRLRDYFVYMLLFIISLLTVSIVRSGALGSLFTLSLGMDIPLYIYGLLLTLVGSALALPFVNSRITFIILTGTLGLLVSLLFTVFSAPDLALTQLLVETVTVIVLLLAFKHLPELTKERNKKSYTMTNVLISGGVGLLVTLLGISSYTLGAELGFERISQFFVENAKTLGGGYNIVNVILVDFRGFDTALEILVLGSVGLAILMLIKHIFKGGEDI